MTKSIIVEGVSKKYTLHHATKAKTGLVSKIADQFRRHKSDIEDEVFWALRDINFEIEEGERIAIIGSNGAGKSTLLKIISRITSPSEGSVRIRGRLSSLLEVGTGFHPDLTGRENVFLNGAILGMSRTEIRKKFDSIVDFAEVEKFIDMPVKHYSSGMYVRLAFAVSVFLEPDIVVLDEVLSVGDSRFQKKSFKKIKELASEGRTVIFVSHSVNAVRSLCSKAMFLESGQLKGYGLIEDVVEMYEAPPKPQIGFGRIDLEDWGLREGKKEGATIRWGEIASPSGKSEVHIGDALQFTFGVRFDPQVIGKTIKMSLVLRSHDGLPIANMVSDDSNFFVKDVREEESISITLDKINLYPSTYSVGFWVGDEQSATYDYVSDCITFQIAAGGNIVKRHLPLGAGLLYLTPDWIREQRV